MMVFITRCYKSARAIGIALMLATLAVTGGVAGAANAGSIEPVDASLNAAEDGYSLAANFNVNIGTHLEDILTKGGVPLYFNLEFILERPRKYWVAEHITSRTEVYRLTYSGLTRQYRLSSGALHTNYNSLEDALRGLADCQWWIRVACYPVKATMQPCGFRSIARNYPSHFSLMRLPTKNGKSQLRPCVGNL